MDEGFPAFLDQCYQNLHFSVCAHQRGPEGDRLGKMYSVYTNKDCVAIPARKLSAHIRLGLSQAETEFKAAVDAAILFLGCRLDSPLQSYPHFIITVQDYAAQGIHLQRMMTSHCCSIKSSFFSLFKSPNCKAEVKLL